jgi:hypothetical protein
MSPSPYVKQVGGLDVIEAPLPTHNYVLSADVAKGVEGDYSAFSVIDISTIPYKIVAKYRDNKISPMLYPSVIHKVANEYNMAYVLIEINVGEQVAEILHSEYEYENIIYVTRTTGGQVVSGGFGSGKTQLGVTTDKKVKRIGCQAFKSLVEEKKLLVTDMDTIAEISTFIEKKNSYMADEGYHDDLVMTLVLFSWLTTNPYFKELNDVNLRQVMYENHMKRIEEELTPFGVIVDGLEDEQEVYHNF